MMNNRSKIDDATGTEATIRGMIGSCLDACRVLVFSAFVYMFMICALLFYTSFFFVLLLFFLFFFFFFFQAEDGIRDWSVTGVQTCALPISTAVEHHVPQLAVKDGR